MSARRALELIVMLIELDYPKPVPVKLEADKTLLLVIDMENENCHPGGALYIGEPVRKVISKIRGLLDAMRRSGGKIVHTQSVRSPDALEFTVFKNTVRKLEGSRGAELIDELKPAAGEPLVVKHTHDCFYKTEMESLLPKLGMRPGESSVIVTGISTRNCVQSAVMAFSVRDYRVVVPMDCTTHNDEKQILQAFSLFTSFGYKHNVTMTRSDMIEIVPPVLLA
ncbi:MAG TPA: isochorismatase family cysteine hydrolase [Candidatus Binatia bacterium]